MGDTDSVYLNLEAFSTLIGAKPDTDINKMTDIIDTFCKKEIEPFIVEKYKELEAYLNACSSRLHMKREAICNRAIVRAKKNYVLQIIDNEGVRYAEPKIKPVGIEIARSSTPEIVRNALTVGLELILNKDEAAVQEFVKQFKQEFFAASLTDIAFPRGVSDIDKWIGKGGDILSGAPIHVKAAISYNTLLVKHKLNRRFPLIRNGDRIKYVYLKEPNPIRNNTVGFLTFIHPEFELEPYIDKETQFDKTFLGPMRSFTTIIGWNTERKISLGSFFDDELVNTKPIVKETQAKPKRVQTSSLDGFF